MANKKEEEKIKLGLGIPQRMELLGFLDGKPILHDPGYPVPDGVMWFLNNDAFEKER